MRRHLPLFLPTVFALSIVLLPYRANRQATHRPAALADESSVYRSTECPALLLQCHVLGVDRGRPSSDGDWRPQEAGPPSPACRLTLGWRRLTRWEASDTVPPPAEQTLTPGAREQTPGARPEAAEAGRAEAPTAACSAEETAAAACPAAVSGWLGTEQGGSVSPVTRSSGPKAGPAGVAGSSEAGPADDAQPRAALAGWRRSATSPGSAVPPVAQAARLESGL